MAGELRTSQFRFTTTADDDFVIGDPSNASAHATKALVFQTNQTPGYATNPHFRCEWNSGSSSWQFIMNPVGNGSASDFLLTGMAYLANSQVFTGNNTLSGDTTIISSPAANITGATINLGTAITDVVNISGILNVAGALNHTSTTNLDVVDKTITLNKGGAAASGGGSGIDIEELVSSVPTITGYIAVNSARTGWSLKAPAAVGITTLIPTASTVSITMPGSTGTLALMSDVSAAIAATHPAVTIGTSNGLSLSTQALSLGLASSTTNGALSSTDWNNFNSGSNALNSQVQVLTDTGSITSIASYTSGAIASAGEGYATASQFISLDAAVTTLNGTGAGSVQAKADARIAAWKTATADSTYASASSFSTLSSNFGTLTGGDYTLISSQISTAMGTYTGLGVSIADVVGALGTTMGAQNASITTTQNSVNGTSAQYGVTLNANGRASGFSLLSGNVFAARAVLTIVPATGPNNVVISGLPANTTPTTSYTVSVPSGSTAYLWAIAGGTITSGNTSNSMTFTTGPGGTTTVACKVTNTVGSVTTITNAVGSTSVIPAPILGSNAAAPIIIGATANVTPGHTGLTASIGGGLLSGHTYTYAWSIGNGTITSPTNTSSVTFTSGATGPYTTLACAVTDTSIPTAQPTFTLAADAVHFVDPASGTDYFTYVAPVSPATVGTFTFNGTVDLTGAVTSEELAASGYLAGLLNDHTNPNTTRIDGGLIDTYTIVANQLDANFAIINNIQSAGEATTHVGAYEVGTTSAPPVGFKISGTPYPTTFLGDSSPSNVQMELGTSANFGGYRVGRVTETLFDAQAISCYGISPNNWGGGSVHLTLMQTVVSGTYLHLTTDQGYVQADITGVYLVTGHTAQSASGCGNHESSIEVWQRPVGTSGSSDLPIINWAESDCNGGTFVPYSALVTMAAGDKLYYKSSSKGGAYVVCNVISLGTIGATTPLTITSTNLSLVALSGQTYPKIISPSIDSVNGIGLLTYSITGGTGSTYVSSLNTALGTFNFSFPSTGSWTLNLHVADSNGKSHSKTITIALSAYVPTPLVNTTASPFSDSTFTYPYALNQRLFASGGQAPYSWVLNSSDIPSAAIAGGGPYLTGSVATPGTYTANITVSDSVSTTPVAFDLSYVISTAISEGGGGTIGCFDPDTTFVLKADNTSCLIKDIKAGDFVRGINFGLLISHGTAAPVSALVTDVLLHDNATSWKDVCGIKTTPEHPWIITYPCTDCANNGRKGYWTRADQLNSNFDYKLVTLLTGSEPLCSEVPAGVVTDTTAGNISMNLGTKAQSYFVGATPTGPWYAVHNIKKDPNLLDMPV